MNLHYMSEEMVEEFVTVESIFVRGRNCLALRAKFSPLFTDYYLHLMQYGLRNEEIYDSLLKELMAYFTLYMVARPWAEQHAWTVNLNTPVVANLFVSGSSLTESVVGRVFTQDVKEPEENTLYSTMLCKGQEPRYSVVPIPGASPAQWRTENGALHRAAGRMLYDGDGPAGRRRGMAQFPQPGKDGPPGRKRKYARAGNPPLPFLLRLYPGPHTPNAQGAPGEGERFVPGGK